MIRWLKTYKKETSSVTSVEENVSEIRLTDRVEIDEDVVASKSDFKPATVSKSSNIAQSVIHIEDNGTSCAERLQIAEDAVVSTSKMDPVIRANVISIEDNINEITAKKVQEDVDITKKRRGKVQSKENVLLSISELDPVTTASGAPVENNDKELTAEKVQEDNPLPKKRQRKDDGEKGKGHLNCKTKRHYKFNEAWLKEETFKGWLKKSIDVKNGHDTAMCSSCNQTLLTHKGDIVRHLNSERHKNLWKQVSSSHKISEYSPNIHFSDSVRRAELKLAALLASNNLPFSLMDTLSPLCSDIFSDSNIAKNLAAKRTKSTGLVKNVLSKNFAAELEYMIRPRGNFFSLIMDETTDLSTTKQCSFTVILFNINNKMVETHFLDMVEVPCSTANELFNCLKNVLSTKNIPLSNLIGFSSDTCNVMVGENNSVFALLKKELPNIACIKCSCHMISLSANRACLKLPRYVEDFIRNLGSHFNRSSKRLDQFKEFQRFFQTDIHRILTMSQTRWLSVKACVDRILEQYAPLEAYLRQAVFEDPSKTTEDMLLTMNNKYTKIYLEFMSYVLGLTTEFNILFQTETPLLHRLKPEVEKLLKNLALNYMDVQYVRSCGSILKAEFSNPRNFVSLDKIYVGLQATTSLQNLKQDPSTTDLLKTCLSFYIELTTDIQKRFDFRDPLFEIINIVDPVEAQKFDIKTLQPVFARFPIIAQHIDQQTVDSEWRQHALLDYNSLGLDPSRPAQEYWQKIFSLKNTSGASLFPNLQYLLGTLMILPYSNASVERVFSALNNIKTCHRNKLNTETVTALMITKDGVSRNGGCLKFEPSKEMLRAKNMISFNS